MLRRCIQSTILILLAYLAEINLARSLDLVSDMFSAVTFVQALFCITGMVLTAFLTGFGFYKIYEK